MKYNIKGYNLDNLLKILASKNISLYNIERTSYNEISFETNDKNIKKIKRYIVNYKVKQGLTNAKKIPKFLLTNLGIILAIFIGSISLLFLSNYTWQIEIYGTENLTNQEILEVLKNNGIKKGKINIQTSEEIEKILLNNYDRIAQVSVIKKGTAIIINLSEKLVYIEQDYQPIIAKYNGIIKSISIITGTTNIKVGDYVNKGDILVLPFNIDINGEKIGVKPIAEIIAEIYIVSSAELNTEEIVLVRTGKFITEYQYKIFNKNLFSGKVKNSFALFETVVYNENVSRLVPLKRKVTKYYELEQQVITHNLEQEQQSVIDKSVNMARKNMIAGEIIDEKTTLSITENKITAYTTIKVLGCIND